VTQRVTGAGSWRAGETCVRARRTDEGPVRGRASWRSAEEKRGGGWLAAEEQEAMPGDRQIPSCRDTLSQAETKEVT